MYIHEMLGGVDGDRSNLELEKKVCRICFGKHAEHECAKIANILEPGNFALVKNKIENSGLADIGEDAIQKALANLANDPQKLDELLKSLTDYYGVEVNSIMKGHDNTGNEVKVRISGIRYDNDFGKYMLKYNRLEGGGNVSPLTLGNSLSSMSFLSKDSVNQGGDIENRLAA